MFNNFFLFLYNFYTHWKETSCTNTRENQQVIRGNLSGYTDMHIINGSSEFQLIITIFIKNIYNSLFNAGRFYYATQELFVIL